MSEASSICWHCSKPWHPGACAPAVAEPPTETCPGCPHPLHGDAPCHEAVGTATRGGRTRVVPCPCDVWSRAEGTAARSIWRAKGELEAALIRYPGYELIGFVGGAWSVRTPKRKVLSSVSPRELLRQVSEAARKAKREPVQEGFGW